MNIIILCWMIFFIYWAISALFVKRSVMKRDWRRNFLLIILVVLFFFFIKSGATNIVINAVMFNSPLILQVLGSILVVIGLAGAIWARNTIGRNWSGHLDFKVNHELITNGPYHLVRHPIYTTILTMLIGTLLYSTSYFILGWFLIALIVFLYRVHEEEKLMIDHFGERYQDYRKKTKALIPFVY